MAQKTYIQVRDYLTECTASDLFTPEGDKIGCALEDVARPVNVKIPGQTCIPEGIYNVNITHSDKYQKLMIQLYNRTEDLAVIKNGVKFEGIRVHGGNDVDDSEGCPLVAKKFDGKSIVWGSLSRKITEQVENYIAAGHSVKWVITSY